MVLIPPKPPRISAGFAAAMSSALACGAGAAPAMAQDGGITSIGNLPRPGYEPRGIRQGGMLILPSLQASAQTESNVFATPDNEEDDVLFLIEPRVEASGGTQRLSVGANLGAAVYRYAENTQEDLETYLAETVLSYSLDSASTLSGGLRYVRDFERRSDPEARDDLTRTPTSIDVFAGEASYSYRPGRLGATASVSASDADFLDPEDDERDLATYTASLRGLAALSADIDAFAEISATRRDFRLDRDFSGVDRDAETVGMRAGLAFGLTDKLVGDIGAGVFDVDNDDPQLEDFSGLSVEGRLAWAPRQRTRVTLSAFRGDVATIRSGASGRIDTRIVAGIEQEIRHDLIGTASLGYRASTFRANRDLVQEDLTGSVALRYLLNRTVAVELGYAARQREADIPSEEFESHNVRLALTLTY